MRHLITVFPLGNQSLKVKLINLFDTLAPETIIKGRVGDITLFYPSKSIIGKFWASGTFRHSFLDFFFQKYLTECNIIVEVGANIGTDTIFMAKKAHEDCQIIAFEPADKYRNLLIQNIGENEIKNVMIYEYFLGNSDEEQFTLHLTSASASVIKNASPSFPSVGKQKVKAITLDSFMVNQKINNIDFLKVDTDGFDLFVLQGAEKCLNLFRPKLMVEFSGYSLERLGVSNRVLAEFL
jgi:FkbM family methyltransferase